MTTDTASIDTWLRATHGVDDITHQAELPLRSIDLVASITNQSRFEPIDEPTVERYVAALENGDTFPAIIVRRVDEQLVILGGNHRARAHLDARRDTIEAYIVVCDDLTALEIGYADNATHGLPPSNAERVAHALVLIDRGRSPAEAARTVGTNPQNVYREQATRGVAKRCANLGLTEEFARVGVIVRPRLASLANDALLTRTLRAIVTEKIPAGTATKLIGDLNAQPTYQAALDLLEVHVAHHRATSGSQRGAGRPSANPYLMLRTALGTIRALNASDILEGCKGKEREELGRLCMDGARHLKLIHDLAGRDR